MLKALHLVSSAVLNVSGVAQPGLPQGDAYLARKQAAVKADPWPWTMVILWIC